MLVKFQPIDTICPSSPIGRGNKLKPCSVKVRILRGVPCSDVGTDIHQRLKIFGPSGIEGLTPSLSTIHIGLVQW